MSAQSGRLLHGIKHMREQWDIAIETWADANAREFHKVHVLPLEQKAKHAAIGMDKLHEFLTKMRAKLRDTD